MGQPFSFDDLQVGMELPSVAVGPITTTDLVKWAGASGDYNPIHYDMDIALAQGLPTVVIPGPYRLALAAAMITRWAAPNGRIQRIECTYRGMDLPGDTLTCGAKVVNKSVDEKGGRSVQLDVWVQNPREKSTTGTVKVLWT